MSGWIRDAPMLSTGIPSRRAGSVDQFPVWGACGSGVIGIIEFWRVRGGGRGYQNGGPPFANLSPRLSLFSDHLRTVLAVKGSLCRAQQRRALDGSGPFRTTLLRRGKGSLRTPPLAGDHVAAISVTLFRRHRHCNIVSIQFVQVWERRHRRHRAFIAPAADGARLLYT